MNRALCAVVLGIAMMGCAAGEEDPVPAPPAPEEQRDPPKQALSGDFQDPVGMKIGVVEGNHGLDRVPAKQRPPGPQPMIDPR
ncbi:MAG: hypothetical protein KF819_14575 [Labilithrix sp.]|nr:hypothetical protein [Labilithrix sp.]